MGVSELGRLRQLEEENQRLKKLVAGLSLNKHILQEVLAKRSEACAATGVGRIGRGGLSGTSFCGRHRACGSSDGQEKWFQHFVMVRARRAVPGLPGARDDHVQCGHHYDEAVV